MKSERKIKLIEEKKTFVEGIDYYFENDLMILTARFLFERGYCCQNNCRNCPYKTRSDENLQQMNL